MVVEDEWRVGKLRSQITLFMGQRTLQFFILHLGCECLQVICHPEGPGQGQAECLRAQYISVDFKRIVMEWQGTSHIVSTQ